MFLMLFNLFYKDTVILKIVLHFPSLLPHNLFVSRKVEEQWQLIFNKCSPNLFLLIHRFLLSITRKIY